MPAVTVIVPTLNEAGNIQPLVERLSAAFGSRDDWEILFVDDDSSDGTGTEIRRAAVRHPVHLIVREGERGLASAVLKGIRSTSAPVVVVMDADLSHPAEVAPQLAAAVEAGADVAIGSRYVRGGGTEGWSRLRLFLSRGAALMTRGLTGARDPGAGFFAIRKSLLEGNDLQVEGFKILLEILAKLRPAKVVEVPIHFAPRHLGKSKVAAGTAIAFLKQLFRLYIARPATHVAALIGLVFVFKVIVGANTELKSVEAYYWLYGQHPALGYYDHPGMIGWLIWLSTAMFGDSPLGVRMLTFACSAVATWLVFLTGRRLYTESAGRFAAMLFAIAYGTAEFGSLATPDAPLLLFWMATLWAVSHALIEARTSWWCAAGLFLGLAMLSKFMAVFLPIGVLLFLAFSPGHRRWLIRKEPYLAALIALAVFSPTLIWNAQNEWQTISYQGLGRMEDSTGFEIGNLRRVLVMQFVLLTPLAALWGWGAGILAVLKWRTAPWADRLVAAVAMPLLVFFTGMIAVRSIRPHWTLVAGATLFLLVGASVTTSSRRWIRRLHYGVLILVMIGAVLMATATLAMGPPKGWSRLAKAVADRNPDFVIAQDYHVASQLAYHLRPKAAVDFTAVGDGGKSFQNWWRGSEHAGRDAVIVWEKGSFSKGLDRVRECFESVGPAEPIDVPAWNETEPYVLIRARSYRPPANQP